MTSRPQQRLASTAEASAPAEESNFSRYAGMAFFATIVRSVLAIACDWSCWG